jgi:Fe-S cluster assembly iron-binding protein IscA
MLRVAFGGYGWGGPRLQLTLDELKDEDDVVIKSQDIMVVYNSGIEEYVKNSIVDYSDSWFERGFVIKGAKTSSC